VIVRSQEIDHAGEAGIYLPGRQVMDTSSTICARDSEAFRAASSTPS